MFHIVARSIDGDPLFDTWAHGRCLWDALVRVSPERIALALMPNHVHLLHPVDIREAVAAAVSGYARWWNHQRGRSGRVFEALPPAQLITEVSKQRRQVRYVHLNPDRARLVPDPLAWPFSTHRDACGLAVPAVVPRAKNVAAFHRYVSSDPHVDVGGTPLPEARLEAREPVDVLHAVSAVTRTPLSWFTVRKVPARHLFLRAAVALCPDVDRAAIAELVGVRRNACLRAARGVDPHVDIVGRVVGDRRFAALHDHRIAWDR